MLPHRLPLSRLEGKDGLADVGMRAEARLPLSFDTLSGASWHSRQECGWARHEVVAQLGAGGMGEVHRAVDTRLDRSVAVKVLPVQSATRPEMRQRLEREARLVAGLNHPRICVLHDVTGIPHKLFEAPFGPQGRNRFVVSPDGKRFLVNTLVEDTAPRSFTVLINGLEAIQRR